MRDSISWDQIKEEVYCKRKPFCVTWHWNGGGGHMMVCPAYCEVGGIRFVTIDDPLPVATGSQRTITYSRYVSGPGYTHWDDYYNVSK